MPSLIGVTTIINAALQTNVFNSQKFQGGNWNTIAEKVREIDGENSRVRPVVVPSDGDCVNVAIDDTYPLVVYHRVTGLEYQDGEWDFGDPGNIKREVASMVLILFADRGRLQITDSDCLAAISANIPDELTNAQLQLNQLLCCTISVEQGNINKQEVFEQEYEGVEYPLKPNSILISIPYKITSDYSKNCFSLCN